MKNSSLLLISMLFIIFGCKKEDVESKKLERYLHSHSQNIASYKIICFVPSNGCESCISHSINYSIHTDKNLLLVLTSVYKKNIDQTIEEYNISKKEIIADSKNEAPKLGFVSEVAPCFYFLKDGIIVKKVDLSEIPDKKSILEEVHKYLSE